MYTMFGGKELNNIMLTILTKGKWFSMSARLGRWSQVVSIAYSEQTLINSDRGKIKVPVQC